MKRTLNLTNPGLISHNEILEMYKEIVDPTFKWSNFSVEEQAKILAADRSNNYLNTEKLESLCPGVKSIKDSVRDMLELYKTHNIPKKSTKVTDFKDSSDTVLLVTGGCGFIGSNFVNLILENYSKITVVNFDAMYYCASETNVLEKWRKSKRYIL